MHHGALVQVKLRPLATSPQADRVPWGLRREAVSENDALLQRQQKHRDADQP